MKATERLCRTADGLRLVPETHPDAAFLAYPVGHEISAADEALLNPPPAPAPADPEPPVETKPDEQAPNKQRRPAKK